MTLLTVALLFFSLFLTTCHLSFCGIFIKKQEAQKITQALGKSWGINSFILTENIYFPACCLRFCAHFSD